MQTSQGLSIKNTLAIFAGIVAAYANVPAVLFGLIMAFT